MIAGYRVMRKLGSSSRADVYLGHARARGGAGAKGEQPGSVAPSGSVALKVFRPDADAASIEREITALSAIPAGRLAELIDLATLPDGRICLVLERLAGGSLSQHLSDHERLEPGEAVTILAPVIAALAGLHAAGLVHNELSQSSIIFDGRGRPVLTGLGALRELPLPGAAGGDAPGTSRSEILRGSYARITTLIRSVFDHLDPEESVARRAEAVATWFELATVGVPFRPCLEELERRLFEWAPAKPVRLSRATGVEVLPAAARSVDGSRLRRVALLARAGGIDALDSDRRGADRSGAEPTEKKPAHRVPLWFEIFHLPPEVRAAAVRTLDERPFERLCSRVRERFQGKRRPLLVAGIVSAAVIMLALTLLPPGEGSSRAGTGQADTAEHGASTTNVESRTNAGSPSSIEKAADAVVLESDDPVAAAQVLLTIRAACLAAASVVCLDGVDQVGSATMAADSYSMRMTQQGDSRSETRDYASYAASLVERTGNSALVALAPPSAGDETERQPVSVFVIKGEAGWRLREIFDY